MTTNRRRFLSAAALAGVAPSVRSASAPSLSDSDEVVLLNDTHIGEKQGPDHIHPQNLQRAVKEILSLPRKPAAIIVANSVANFIESFSCGPGIIKPESQSDPSASS